MPNERNLTEAEADKLFRQMSKAVSSSDDEALTALVSGNGNDTDEVDEPELDTQEDEALENDEPEETPETDDSPEDAGDDDGKEEDEEPTEGDDEDTDEPSPDKDTPDEDDPAQAEIKKLKDQLAAVEQQNQQYRRNAGRVPFLQSQLTKLEKKIGDMGKARSPADLNKRAEKLKAALADIEEIDPKAATAIQRALLDLEADLRAEFASSQTEVYRTVQESTYEEILAEQQSKLLGYFPRAYEVFETPAWQTWVANQTPGVQQMADSLYADDVWRAMNMFVSDMQMAGQIGAPQQPEETETPKAPDPDEQRKAEKIKAQREKNRNAPVVTPKPAAKGKVPGTDATEEELEQFFLKKIRKEMGKE